MKPRFAVGLGALAVALAFVNASPSAQAPGALTGTYTGASQCIQGATNLKLTLLATPDGGVFGTVTVNLPAGTQKDAYTYSIQGTFSPATRKFVLTPVKWETAAPPNFGMLGFNGTFDSNELTGTLTGGGCTSFNVERARAATPVVAAASSSSAPAPAPSATAAPAPVAPPPAPPSVAPPAPAARTAAAKSPATPAPARAGPTATRSTSAHPAARTR